MKVTDVRTILVTAPWKGDPFWVPGEEFWRTAALIEVTSDGGLTRLGETVMGYFAAEVVPPLVDYYRRLLVDPDLRLDPTQPERCFDELYQRSLWWGRTGLALSVLSGIEMALWDLAGKAAGKPVHELLGGAVHERLPMYASGGTGGWPVQKTVDQAKRYVDLGYRGLKIGSGMTDRPGTYATTVSPAPYGHWIASQTAHRADDEHEKFRGLRRQTTVPIAGGECLTGVGEFADWFARDALDIAQPDATHVGGIGPCLAVGKAAAANHAGLIVHTGAAIGPGLMANLHVAFASPNARFVEYALAPDNVREEMLHEPVRLDDGFVRLPQAPGLGVELRPDFIDKYPFRPGIVEYA